jgi:POT family proton-dependent oligopeptide transporter
MDMSATAARAVHAGGSSDQHPKGLYVLFATEMWERFSYYSMLAMFTLYLRDTTGEGFAWTSDSATSLYANYLMFVYASPLIGGWLADRKLGYRKAVMIGGLFFMAGHLLLSFRSMTAVYAALTCLVIGNGLFKPNISAMVGNLYPEGSHLKDRAYNIFYMGINVGAFLAPVVAEFVKGRWGFHVAFAVAALGMAISVTILWKFKRHIESADAARIERSNKTLAHGSAVAVDAPPASVSHQDAANASRQGTMEAVPEWKRIGALIIIFLIVIVFWMVFHQNGSTMTYWANENTDWDAMGLDVSGIISNAINPLWVMILTFPLVAFWRWLDNKGMEPSTPVKMAIGMFLTGAAFFVLYLGAKVGEGSVAGELTGDNRWAYKVSAMWLISAYGVLTLGELMLSPMGLSLVSKVAPVRFRGVMMGGWFMATAIGNKLTQIGRFGTIGCTRPSGCS